MIASTSAKIFSSEPTTELLEIGDMLKPHLLPHSILPDLEEVDLSNQAVAANALVLVELANRAERQQDPYHGLEELYYAAERSLPNL